MNIFQKAWDWILFSSKNADNRSLSVKMAGLAIIPYAMYVVGFGCTSHLVCIPTNADELTTVVMTVSNIVFWSLSLVSGFGFVIGFARKVAKSFAGSNAVIASWSSEV